MREMEPKIFLDQRHQIILDLDRILLLRQFQSVRETDHMCIHDNAFDLSKCRTKYDIRCLAADPRQGEQFIHRLGNDAVMSFEQCL